MVAIYVLFAVKKFQMWQIFSEHFIKRNVWWTVNLSKIISFLVNGTYAQLTFH